MLIVLYISFFCSFSLFSHLLLSYIQNYYIQKHIIKVAKSNVTFASTKLTCLRVFAGVCCVKLHANMQDFFIASLL